MVVGDCCEIANFHRKRAFELKKTSFAAFSMWRTPCMQWHLDYFPLLVPITYFEMHLFPRNIAFSPDNSSMENNSEAVKVNPSHTTLHSPTQGPLYNSFNPCDDKKKLTISPSGLKRTVVRAAEVYRKPATSSKSDASRILHAPELNTTARRVPPG